MPFTAYNETFLSDLVVHEQDPSVGYARRTIVVQSSDTVPVKFGQLVFRVKNVSTTAPYAPVTAAAALVATNEFAVAFGDKYSMQKEWIAGAAATAVNTVAFVKGDVILKDKGILSGVAGMVFGDANYVKMKQLLENQGIIIEQTL